MNDVDRRVIYTKRTLRAAIMKLMEEKSVSRISVTELCTAAGVNRGTFYAHYRKPEDVMHEVEAELVRQISEVLKTESDNVQLHRNILNIIDANKPACRVLFGENGNREIMDKLLNMSIDHFAANYRDELRISDFQARCLHSFLFAGISQIIKEWVYSEDKRTVEEMTQIIVDLQKNILPEK